MIEIICRYYEYNASCSWFSGLLSSGNRFIRWKLDRSMAIAMPEQWRRMLSRKEKILDSMKFHHHKHEGWSIHKDLSSRPQKLVPTKSVRWTVIDSCITVVVLTAMDIPPIACRQSTAPLREENFAASSRRVGACNSNGNGFCIRRFGFFCSLPPIRLRCLFRLLPMEEE